MVKAFSEYSVGNNLKNYFGIWYMFQDIGNNGFYFHLVQHTHIIEAMFGS